MANGLNDRMAVSFEDEGFDTGVAGRYWHRSDDGKQVICDLCPRECALRPGQRGLCFVRANVNGAMVLTTYGRSSGFCIDPIEKKPLNHFYPGTPVLSFGTAGCNLTCKFCQNWDISKSRQFDRLQSKASPELIAEAALKSGCRSVAYTYNDPVIFLEYAVDVAKACRERGIKNVAVTAGYISSEARTEFFEHMDAANIDLKAFTEAFYYSLTSSRLADVLETLKYLRNETDVWFEITNLIIPSENDRDEELKQMSDWVVEELGQDVPLHFSAFHPDWKMPNHERTPPDTLFRARNIAIEAGVNHAYCGNIHDKESGSTWCSGCGQILIGRDWYELSDWNLDATGACVKCGTRCPGVFEPRPGSWGRKRMQVRMT